VLFNILKRAKSGDSRIDPGCLAIYSAGKLIAMARQEKSAWELERVFLPQDAE
jgi:hypothetical protein